MKFLNELLNIKYPIIQGGMARITTGKFAGAVSEAGGLGLIATGGFSADDLRKHIADARAITDKPFGVNVLLLHPQAEEIAKIIIEEKIQIVTTGAGDPSSFMAAWKAAGVKVIPVVPSVALARRMERTGCFAVIAEGTESGGHIGETTTMALVPQIVDAVGIPVIAAGGIADGRQLLAAFALGAVGVQIGTVLMASDECPIHENYKNKIVSAKDRDTIVTGRSAGAPVRVLKNKMSKEYTARELAGATRDELEEYTLGSLNKAVFDGDVEMGSLMAGQVAGMVSSVRPVAQILENIISEYEEQKRKFI
jgi:enoyl-[acyl-carrier protein] reductase II